MTKRFAKLALSLLATGAMVVTAAFAFSTGVEAKKGSDRSDEKDKVHVTGKVMGNMGVTAEEVEQAFEESIHETNPNIEFVSEKGEGVEEITVAIQLDDGDADHDGKPDAEDNDNNGDGIADDQEVIGTVDLDQKDPELLNQLHDTKKGQGMNILLEANDEKHHIIKFETKADPPSESGTASLNRVFRGMSAHASALKVPKWLKTTFTVVSYTARFASCATGSIGTCIGLLAEGYGGKR